MDTSRLSDRALKTADDLKTMVRERSADLLKRSAELRDRAPIVIERRKRPMWQTGALWFATGMAIAAAVGFFFDRQRGAARRQMAVDRTVATARDVGEWGGKKARHLRNKAQGTMAEMRPTELDEAQGSSRY
jgi:hypothetical protein